jgi:hypothetical protein
MQVECILGLMADRAVPAFGNDVFPGAAERLWSRA